MNIVKALQDIPRDAVVEKKTDGWTYYTNVGELAHAAAKEIEFLRDDTLAFALHDEVKALKISRIVFAFVFMLIGFAAGFMLAYIGV